MEIKEGLKGLEFFESLLDTPQNSLVDKAIAEGRIPIGYACYITPEPLLMVDSAFPVRLRAPHVTDTTQANYYMSLLSCMCARSVLETLIDGRYDFLKGIIGGGACMHINRCIQHVDWLDNFKDRIADKDFVVHTLDAPRKNSPATRRLFVKDMKQAAASLTEAFGLDYSDESLRKAIIDLNRYRAALKRLSDLRRGPEVKITGTEFHKVVLAGHVAPKDMLIEPIEALIKEVEEREPIQGVRARIMITGTSFDKPEFTQLIEDQGALVVADRYCFGSIPGLEQIPVDGDPWENLIMNYLDTCECARMMENSKRRFDQRKEYIDYFNVEGVVLETMKFCDTWSYEATMNMDRYKDINMPFMRLEHDNTLATEGQIRTRIQAFVESIENKRLVR